MTEGELLYRMIVEFSEGKISSNLLLERIQHTEKTDLIEIVEHIAFWLRGYRKDKLEARKK